MSEILSSADIAFANLETPILIEPDIFNTFRSLTFRANPSDANLLAAAGFDVISIANNHTFNLGYNGAPTTIRHLKKSGLLPVGAGVTKEDAFTPVLIERNGVKIAFLAVTTWLNGHNESGDSGAIAYVRERDVLQKVPAMLANIKDQADIVIVSLHWGRERHAFPNSSQKRAAHAMIDAGAHLVLGHHPHVVQTFEHYHGGFIAYSLGNFLFDHPSTSQRQTLILETVFSVLDGVATIQSAIAHPVIINDKLKVPQRARGKQYATWARRLKRLGPTLKIASPAYQVKIGDALPRFMCAANPPPIPKQILTTRVQTK